MDLKPTSGEPTLCETRSLRQAGALCVGPRHSLSRAPALSVSGPSALCVGPTALHHIQLTKVESIASKLDSDSTFGFKR